MAILTGQYYSEARARFVSFSVALPVDVQDETGKPAYLTGPFPTLYLLHGFSGNHMDWLYNGMVAQLAVRYRLAVVMPSGENSFYLDNCFSGDACSDFIGRELVDVTRKMFPLSTRREDTFIGGLSMGGFGALRNGLYWNDVFSAVIALSSALITDEVARMKPGESNGIAPYSYYVNTFGDLHTLTGSDRDPKALAARRKAAGEVLPRIFMACGTEDFLYPNNLDMHGFLTELGISHTWITRPGVHDFEFWNAGLALALEWLQKEEDLT